MKIIKVCDPVHYAAKIEGRMLALDINVTWRTGLRPVWDIVGQYHVFVTHQVSEDTETA